MREPPYELESSCTLDPVATAPGSEFVLVHAYPAIQTPERGSTNSEPGAVVTGYLPQPINDERQYTHKLNQKLYLYLALKTKRTIGILDNTVDPLLTYVRSEYR